MSNSFPAGSKQTVLEGFNISFRWQSGAQNLSKVVTCDRDKFDRDRYSGVEK
jgi:hypothetical protein